MIQQAKLKPREKQMHPIDYSHIMEDICKPFFNLLGLANLGYWEIYENGTAIYINTNSQHYEAIQTKDDLLINTPDLIMQAYPKQGFYMLDLDHHAKNVMNKYVELRKDFNYGNSFRYINIMKNEKGRFIREFAFEADLNNKMIGMSYINNIELFKEFFHYFENHMRKIRKSLQPLYLKERTIDALHAYLGFRKELKINNKDTFPTPIDKRAISPQPYLKTILTDKQKEVIKWSIAGKTAEETAIIMNLSRRTVERYFEILRKKLCCNSKQQIIVTVLRENLLD